MSPSFTPQSLLEVLQGEQISLTAVDQFTHHHQTTCRTDRAEHYRNLIPLSTPKVGEQYAFEVELDACSGCKACVVACHNLNGLEEDEIWRSVGVLYGGSSQSPVLQHVTTACHHCVEPACLLGCPVNAYEKDELTGIVRHLDDQCIGCQYCILKCPYDVPRYSRSKGIVRKCDMCHDRLAVGEAPACVQACPNSAIRISVVKKQSIVEESETNLFLPGAPEPSYTLPSTVYKTKRSLPRNLLPADYYSARAEHGHIALVFMLVLTQMSVGAFFMEQVWAAYHPASPLTETFKPVHLIGGWLLGMLGLSASILHLGRPLYAFRAILGLRNSWLSREILAFGIFAGLATAAALTAWTAQNWGISLWPQELGWLAAGSGIAAVLCSAMIYIDTHRPYWTTPATAVKFLLTSTVLGLPLALMISLTASAFLPDLTVRVVMNEQGQTFCRWIMLFTVAKLLCEASIFFHLRRKQFTPLRRTALLLTEELATVTIKRYFLGILGGIGLPLLLLNEYSLRPETGFTSNFLIAVSGLMWLSLMVGELLERYLFFSAVVAPKMPGSPAS